MPIFVQFNGLTFIGLSDKVVFQSTFFVVVVVCFFLFVFVVFFWGGG